MRSSHAAAVQPACLPNTPVLTLVPHMQQAAAYPRQQQQNMYTKSGLHEPSELARKQQEMHP